MPRAIGQISTSATTRVPIYATAYVEQTSGAQRSFKSASASDAAAGTGVRKVKVTYYTLGADGTITGPFVETVTLTGTVAVATVATNIALIEKIEAVAVGSGGVAAGVISMCVDNAGAGSVFASIAAGDVRTRYAHHYVPSNRGCEITDLETMGGDATAALIEIDSISYPPGVEQPFTGMYGSTWDTPRGVQFADRAMIPGPARVRMLVTPGNGDAQETVGSFGFIDRQTSAI